MVQNLIGYQNNPVVNQFVINTEKYIYFQSYKSVVCKFNKTTKEITLSQHWDYSRTTSKYLYMFFKRHCGIDVTNKKEVLYKLKHKEFKLAECNSLIL